MYCPELIPPAPAGPALPGMTDELLVDRLGVDGAGVLRATSYFHVVGPGNPVAGVYEDEFETDGNEWLIRRKTIRVEIR